MLYFEVWSKVYHFPPRQVVTNLSVKVYTLKHSDSQSSSIGAALCRYEVCRRLLMRGGTHTVLPHEAHSTTLWVCKRQTVRSVSWSHWMSPASQGCQLFASRELSRGSKRYISNARLVDFRQWLFLMKSSPPSFKGEWYKFVKMIFSIPTPWKMNTRLVIFFWNFQKWRAVLCCILKLPSIFGNFKQKKYELAYMNMLLVMARNYSHSAQSYATQAWWSFVDGQNYQLRSLHTECGFPFCLGI